MKKKATKAQRQNYLNYAFDCLTPQNQTNLEIFTDLLAKSNKPTAEVQIQAGSSGSKGKRRAK